jgi:ectoine hydroxylase-related dioxygenase (phytanoyl-CoA dioxygenase family)
VNFDYDTSDMNAGVFDESRRTLIPLDPGDAVIFHPHLAHGSGPNASPLQRRLVALWFIAGRPSIRVAGLRIWRRSEVDRSSSTCQQRKL